MRHAEKDFAGLVVLEFDVLFQGVRQRFVACLIALNNLAGSLVDGYQMIIFVQDLHGCCWLYESQVIQEDQQDGNGHYPSYREQIECNHRPLDTFGAELRLLIAVTGENPADEDRHSHGSERHHDAGGYLVV